MNKTRISKLDAARRQLDISINLFFYDRDLVAIHTLAAAAFNVLADLLKQQGRSERTLRGKLLESVKKEHQVTVLRKVREAENFFKHADRDPNAFLELEPRLTHFILFDACAAYRATTGENPPLVSLFGTWFMMTYPDLFILPKNVKDTRDEAIQSLKELGKRQYFEVMLPRLMRLDSISS